MTFPSPAQNFEENRYDHPDIRILEVYTELEIKTETEMGT